jgi:hypothetical protein
VGTPGIVVVGSGDGKGGDMLIIPLLMWWTGECRPVGAETGGIDGAVAIEVTMGDGTGGGPPPPPPPPPPAELVE